MTRASNAKNIISSTDASDVLHSLGKDDTPLSHPFRGALIRAVVDYGSKTDLDRLALSYPGLVAAIRVGITPTGKTQLKRMIPITTSE